MYSPYISSQRVVPNYLVLTFQNILGICPLLIGIKDSFNSNAQVQQFVEDVCLYAHVAHFDIKGTFLSF